MTRPTRRSVLLSGCVAVIAAAPNGASALQLPVLPGQVRAMPPGTPAPRSACPHEGCRYQRGGESEGWCALGAV